MSKTESNKDSTNNAEKLLSELLNYLKEHETKEEIITHTSFGPPWGRYNITDDDYSTFIELYSNVYTKVELYIIERPKVVGPLVIDLDFKYKNRKDRIYTVDDIKYIVTKVNKIIKNYFSVTKNSLIGFVTEKEGPTEKKEGEYKDGFHIMYPRIALNYEMRYLVIDKLREELRNDNLIKKLNCINSVDDIIDHTIVKNNGWCMYGSKKKDGQLYKLTHVYKYDLEEENIKLYDKKSLPLMLSNRKYNETDIIKFHSKLNMDSYNKEIDKIKTKYGLNKPKIDDAIKLENKLIEHEGNYEDEIYENEQQTEIELEEGVKKEYNKNKQLNNKYNKLKSNITDIETAKKLVKLLSVKRATEYVSWRDVCYALYNTSPTLLDAFKEFSKKCPNKYNPNDCIKMWNSAVEPTKLKEQGKGVFRIASLHKWAREDDLEGYENLIRENISDILEEAESGTEYDVAKVVYEIYKHDYKCTSLKNDTWYEFQKHRWVEVEKGYTLKLNMSENLTKEFAVLAGLYFSKCSVSAGIEKDNLINKASNVAKIIVNLKKSPFKSRVMEEASHLFYDSEFEEKLDSYRNLIGFDNGVYDLDTDSFRAGTPDDYITYTVGYDYKEYNMNEPLIKEIEDFFRKIQLEDDMRKYVLTLLASYLDGYTKQQKFILWTGIGCHSKGTKILKYDGKFEKVENIKVGDLLMGDDSTPRTVKQLFRGVDKLYKIKPHHMKEFYVNGNHVLSLKSKQGKIIQLRVDDYYNNIEEFTNYYLYKNKIEFNNETPNIDGYTFGYNINKICYNCVHELDDILKKYNIENYNKRYIPNEYLLTNSEYRFKILAGLVDANSINMEHYRNSWLKNYIPKDLKNKAKYIIGIGSKKLTNNIIYLINSLGLKYKKKKITTGLEEYYLLIIYGKISDIPTIEKKYKGTETDNLYKFKIKEDRTDKYYGYELDKNQRYVMEDFLITRNSNGKSTCVELFQTAFGEYCGILPSTVLTKKKGASSGATPEVAELKGKRFVVIQEPEGDDKIYVGYMKELTGGDTIYARPLFKEPIKFKPQFKLLLTCNKLPNIPSNDGGTWRRLRVTPWESEFVDVDDNGLYNGEELKKNQFPKDYDILDKFEQWKGVFLWYLLKKYYPIYKNEGLIEPSKVLAETKKYKKNSDKYLEFIEDNYIITGKKADIMSLITIYAAFKEWYKNAYNDNNCPSKNELKEYFISKDYKMDKGYVIGIQTRNDQDIMNN